MAAGGSHMSATRNDHGKAERAEGELSPRFRKQWLGYAAAAGAVLTTASAGRADIITTTVDLSFQVDAPGCGWWVCQEVVVPVSLTPGGFGNFQLQGNGYYAPGIGKITLGFVGQGATGAESNAAALPKGAPIGPHGAFTGSASMVRAFGLFYRTVSTKPPGRGIYGPWRGSVVSSEFGDFGTAGDAYLGLQFYMDGQAHYGWAEVSLSDYTEPGGAGVYGEITAYAYDTVANQGISAGQTSDTPEPGTLGLLALGSVGLGFWRKRKAVSTVKDTAA
jgi:hypothetical protein